MAVGGHPVTRSRRSASSCWFTLFFLLLSVEFAFGSNRLRRRAKQFAREMEEAAAAAAEEGVAAAAGETIDPLGYYRYKWTAPTDDCGTEPHADYDGTRAWNWGLDKGQHVAGPKECCAKCKAHPKCNSWVYCPEPVWCGAGLHLRSSKLAAQQPVGRWLRLSPPQLCARRAQAHTRRV